MAKDLQQAAARRFAQCVFCSARFVYESEPEHGCQAMQAEIERYEAAARSRVKTWVAVGYALAENEAAVLENQLRHAQHDAIKANIISKCLKFTPKARPERCGTKCQAAKKENCSCECEGFNHGRAAA